LLNKRQQREKDKKTAREEVVELVLTSDSSDDANDHDNFATPAPSATKRSCRAKSVVTTELSAALDRTKVSD
jgi:hypothetical protein